MKANEEMDQMSGGMDVESWTIKATVRADWQRIAGIVC